MVERLNDEQRIHRRGERRNDKNLKWEGTGLNLLLKLLLASVQEKPSEVLFLAVILKLGASGLHLEAQLGIHFAELRLSERLVKDLLNRPARV
jgi:hypothetical protein